MIFLNGTILISALLLLLCGCGNPFGSGPSNVDSNYGPPPAQVKKLNPLGFDSPSAARITVSSTANKAVLITAGSPVGELRLVSSQSRLIYLNVQGQLISR